MRPRVFMDFSAGSNEPVLLGRIVFELFSDSVPKTCENFRALATGEKGVSPISGAPLFYKDSIIHRSIKNFMIQGGDFTKRDGTGGESVYGSPFADEDLSVPIDSAGLLVMANRGPNTNGSQFFISLAPSPHLHGKHVVFGRVVKGLDIVEKIAQFPTDAKDRPLQPIVVVHCGELVLRKDAAILKAQARKRSVSDTTSESEEEKKKRHKKDKSKKKHKRARRTPESETETLAKPTAELPRQETEEEYDARLEREENERIQEAKRKALEDLKQKEQEMARAQGTGIRYKGRGQMKFVDPESRTRNADRTK